MKTLVSLTLKPIYICIAFFCVVFCNSASGQASISIDNIVSGTYAAGGSIAVDITPSGTYSDGNVFQVYLSDASGNFTSQTLIGSYTGTYIGSINATLPPGLAAGSGYKIKVVSTAPATSTIYSGNITVTNSTTVTAGAAAVFATNTIVAGEVYGSCSSAAGKSFSMTNTSTAGATITYTLTNDQTGADASSAVTFDGSQWKFTLPVGYYTFTVTATLNGVISTASYTILNSTTITNLGNYNSTSGCKPDTIKVFMSVDAVGTNYPGLRYQIVWGDGTIEIYTLDSLRKIGGVLAHEYTKTSCGETNNSFQVTATIVTPSNWSNCTLSNTSVSTPVKVFLKPEATFTYSSNPICVNTTLTVTSTSLVGQGSADAGGDVCEAKALYAWYVDGVLKYSSAATEAQPPNLVLSFPTAGKHAIQLLVSNDPCGEVSKIDTICVEDKPDTVFTITPAKNCVPFTVTTDTTYNGKYYCNQYTQKWQVLDTTSSQNAVSTSVYQVTGGSMTGAEPSIKFLTGGQYYIKYTTSNSCGTFSAEKLVQALYANVTMPAAKRYCDTLTVNFATNTSHKPTYSTTAGVDGESYSWTVTGAAGGTATFKSGTSATSQYPVISFNNYDVYTVTVKFTNICGTQTATQTITFDQPLKTSYVIPLADTTVCYGTMSVALTALHSGPYGTLTWSSTGTGTFSSTGAHFSNAPTNTLDTTTYYFSAADTVGKTITITYKATQVSGSACTTPNITRIIKIYPANKGNDLTQSICSGSTFTQALNSSISGSTFTYTSVSDASITGASASGSTTPISNVLTNSSDNASGLVTYTVTPKANGCTGTPYTIKITVLPKPTLTLTAVPATAICSGDSIKMAVTSTVSGATYTWKIAAGTGTVSGYTTSSQSKTMGSTVFIDTIRNALSNTTNTDATVVYTVDLKSSVGCSAVTKTQTITVHPKVTTAAAGADQKLCQVTQATLTGNTATVGTGQWIQTYGPTATITTPGAATTTVTGLQQGQEYRFVWLITDNTNGCGSSVDTVYIYDRAAPTTATVTSPLVICDFDATNSAKNSVTLTGNGNLLSTETGKWTVTSQPTGSTYSFSDGTATHNNAVFTVSKSGVYKLTWSISGDAGCTPSTATLEVHVYDPPAIGTIADPAAVCAGTPVTVTIPSYTGTIVKWQYSMDNGTTWKDSLVTVSSVTFQNPVDTFLVHVIVASNGAADGCVSTVTSNNVVVNVSAPSQGGQGKDTTICQGTSGNIQLTNYLGTITGWEYSTDGGTTWTTVSGASGARLNYSSLQTTTKYRAIVKNGVCSQAYSSVSTVTVVPGITQPTVGADQSLCNVTSTTITASALSGTETGKWTSVYVASSAPSITNDLSASTTVSNLSSGTYTFTWTVSNGYCPVKTASINVDVASPAEGGTATGGGVYCKGSVPNRNITLNSYSGSIIRWESTTDGVTWTPISNTTSVLPYNNSLTVTTAFRAVLDNGGCTTFAYSNNDTVYIKNPVTLANAGADQDLCAATSTTITGNAVASGETGVWSQSVKNRTGATIDATTATTTVSGLVPGNTYTFLWTINNGGTCPNSADSVDVVIRPALTNVIDTLNKFPDTFCEGVQVTITGGTPTGGNGSYTYQWQYSTDDITWADFGTLSTARDFSFTAAQTLYIRRKVTSGPCTTYSNEEVVTVRAAIANNTITADQTICINTAAALLDGATPTDGGGSYIYAWQQSIDAGLTWSDIAGASSEDYDPGVLVKSTKYRRNVTTQLCAGLQMSTSNIVTITVNPDAKAAFSALDTLACAPFVIDASNIVDTPYVANNSAYQWLADGVTIGTTSAFPGYTINNIDDSVTIRLVVTSLYGCKNDSMQQKFFSYPKPDPSFTVNQDSSCGPYTVQFTNTSPVTPRVVYTWDLGNGTTYTGFTPADVTYPIQPERRDTFYVVKLSATTECEEKVYIDTIKVYAAPKATFTPSATTGCSPFIVDFNNNSLGERITYTWNFDDGSADSVTTIAGLMRHTFTTYVQDTFHVRLVATNSCGSDTMIYNIVVAANPIKLNMAINGDQREGCAPLTVQFNNNTRGANAFRWDFGDGNVLNTTENIDTIRHTFTTPGNYTITLIASSLCSDTTGYAFVTVLAVPDVDFSATPTQVCIGDSISFTNNSSSTLTGLVWKFGDGDSSVSSNPYHAYKYADTFNVTLTGSIQYASGNVCSTTATHPVTVIASLPGAFTVSDSLSNCVPFTVTFTNLITPSALTTWNFADGSSATGDVVTHTFTTNGVFTVSMTALDPGGCTYVASKNITVQGPQGQLAYDNGYVCASKSVRFEAYAQRTSSYKWVFGDGDTLTTTDSVVYHIYKQAGTYTPAVELLTSACGVWLYGTQQIKVDYYDAGFTSIQQKTCGNSLVAFTDTSRSYFGIQSWSWDFGDGGVSGERNPQHSYNGANSFPVRLIITGISGCTDTALVSVPVQPNNSPVAEVMSATSGCTGQTMMFTANVISEDSVSLYAWNFSNNFATNGEQISAKFGTSGAYTATLVAGTINGCYDTVVVSFIINPTPIVTLGDDVTICRGSSTQLRVTGATEAAWSPVNYLDCGNCLTPIATPLETQQYVARGSNIYGCSSTDTIVINVVQPSALQVSATDTICVGQSVQLYATGAEKYRWWPSATLTNPTSSSPVATPVLTTTYYVEGSDSLNCFRDTGTIIVTVGEYPQISLGPDKVLSTGTEVPLAATYINGPMISWTWYPATNLSCADCAIPVATVKTDVCYTLTAENVYHCTGKDTICIQAFCEGTQVYIPNAFVPGSVNNGVLMVRGKGIKTVKSFRIFNRWGQVVFERANIQPNDRGAGWDGTIKGVPGTPDVYVYTCEVVCEDGKSFTYKGNVAILK